MAAGCAATGCLHVVFSFVVAGLGSLVVAGREGHLLVLPFWAAIGLLQYAYVAPLAVVVRRHGRVGLARGLWLGAALFALANLGYWLGIGYLSVRSQDEVRRIREFEKNHPIEHLKVRGTIVSADAGRVEVKTADGLVSLAITSATGYVRLKPGGGYEAAGPEIVQVGAEVSVDGTRSGNAPASALILRVKAQEDP